MFKYLKIFIVSPALWGGRTVKWKCRVSPSFLLRWHRPSVFLFEKQGTSGGFPSHVSLAYEAPYSNVLGWASGRGGVFLCILLSYSASFVHRFVVYFPTSPAWKLNFCSLLNCKEKPSLYLQNISLSPFHIIRTQTMGQKISIQGMVIS